VVLHVERVGAAPITAFRVPGFCRHGW
jgi:hypothetical protein